MSSSSSSTPEPRCIVKHSELPSSANPISILNEVRSHMFSVVDTSSRVCSDAAKEILPSFVTEVVEDPLTLWDLLISFVRQKGDELRRFLSTLLIHREIYGKMVVAGQYVGLRDYILLGSSIPFIHHFRYLTPLSRALEDGAEDIARKYLSLSDMMSLEMKTKGFYKAHNAIVESLKPLLRDRDAESIPPSDLSHFSTLKSKTSIPLSGVAEERRQIFSPYYGPLQLPHEIGALKWKLGKDICKRLIFKTEDGDFPNRIARILRWNGMKCLVEILDDGQKVNLSLVKRHMSVFSDPDGVLPSVYLRSTCYLTALREAVERNMYT